METPKRPYHHGDLRDALLRAGQDALEAGGVETLSLRELSRQLGVSNTAPRRHFADKRALLDALALNGYERLGADMAKAVEDCSLDFDARIKLLGRAYVQFALGHPALLGLMFAAKQRPGVDEKLREASERALRIGGLTVVEGQQSGEVVDGDPRRLGMVVFAALQGLVAISTGGKVNGVPLDDIVADLLQQIILGLRPRSG